MPKNPKTGTLPTRMERLLSNPIIRRVAKNSAYLFSASGISVALSFFQNLLVTNLLGVAMFGMLGGWSNLRV